MRVESCWSWTADRSRGRLALLLFAACLFSPGAAAETLLMMRAICNGSLVTGKEGTLSGYEDFVQLSSVHHDLEAPAASDLSGQQRMNLSSFRIAKAFSASSVLMIQNMAQGNRCDIQIDHLVPDTDSGMMVLRWQLVLERAYVVARKEWSTGGAQPPQDSFAFTPESVEWSYFREDGSPTYSFSWSFAAVK